MNPRNYTMSIEVDQTPEAVFAAINNVRGWWSEDIEGRTDKVDAHFTHHLLDVHRCEIKIKDLVSGEKVVWSVVDNYFSFTQDKNEWKGTEIVFDIARRGGKTEVRFTHLGLVPEYECYGVCSSAWHNLINGSLHQLIERGSARPELGETDTDGEPSLLR